MNAQIIILPGDGIGPEVVAVARRVLNQVADGWGHDFSFEQGVIGGAAIDECGAPLPDETLQACRQADAVLLGAVGGPAWDDVSQRPEHGLLALRQGLAVFANLRPVRVYPALVRRSALRPEVLEGVDFMVVRELTSGLYFGRPKCRDLTPRGRRAVDTLSYDEHEISRVVELACELASERRGQVVSIDKANVLATGQLWREVASEVGERYPNVELSHQLVDAAAMRLISQPRAFDVIVTSNMFGDILTDEAAALCGSLGMLPSASLGSGRLGLYEPVHGSAPDIAGQGIANPIGCVASAAMLLRHSLGLTTEALAVERAIERTIEDGVLTPDLGGCASSRAVGDAICRALGDPERHCQRAS